MVNSTMTATDDLLKNNEAYTSSFSKGDLPHRIKNSPFVPEKGSVRGFVYEVETGKLREVG